MTVNRLEVQLLGEHEVDVVERGIARRGRLQRVAHGVLDEPRLQMRMLDDEQLVGALQQLEDG